MHNTNQCYVEKNEKNRTSIYIKKNLDKSMKAEGKGRTKVGIKQHIA